MIKLSKSRLLRGAVFTGLLLAFAGALVPAKADWNDHDARWREHERREADWRRHHEYERHWDHAYWHDHPGYGYAPPPVYYQPAPPPGVAFSFGFR